MVYWFYMNRGKRSAEGYTIVEVLIFLAVTGLLFAGAVVLIGGQQGRAEFSSSVNEFETEIRDVINNVATGYYPSTQQIDCSVSAGSRPLLSSGSNNQGTNENCIYLGRVIQFAPVGSKGGYILHSVAARRFEPVNNKNDVVSLSEALPVLIHPPSGPDMSDSKELSGGATVGWVRYKGSQDVGGFGFMSSFTPTTVGSTDIVSGSTRARLVVPVPVSTDLSDVSAPLINTVLNQLPDEFVTQFNNLEEGNALINPPGGVEVCLNSGGSNQHAIITIGDGTSSSFATRSQISGGDCP